MRAVLLLIAGLALTGCESILLLEGGAMMGTEKTFSDHVLSWTSNKDCSTYRTLTGRTYCKEDDIQPKPKVHCYRTLGEITCYAQPERSGRSEVGQNDHNYDENAAGKR